MLQNKTDNKNYSIGVVTYHARFETYFKPLITTLTEIFPDKEILCILNGHPDKMLQIKYLDRATTFLAQFKNIRYLTNETHQSLSKCWNQIIILSKTEKVLELNDDTQVTALFRTEFEEKALGKDFSMINNSWSHFLISKSTIKKVGWFDERLLGVGHEDGDFSFRMVLKNIPVTNTKCLGLLNYVADQANAGWKEISGVIHGKYSSINEEFFLKKWWVSNEKPPKDSSVLKWGPKTIYFRPLSNEQTPLFYETSVLDSTHMEDNSARYSRKSISAIRIVAEKLFYLSKDRLKRAYRSIRAQM